MVSPRDKRRAYNISKILYAMIRLTKGSTIEFRSLIGEALKSSDHPLPTSDPSILLEFNRVGSMVVDGALFYIIRKISRYLVKIKKYIGVLT
jgi:hypothetical protein